MSSPFSDVNRALRELGNEIDAYTEAMVKKETRPDVLLHFTDSAGLMGIFQGQALWASLATTLGVGA